MIVSTLEVKCEHVVVGLDDVAKSRVGQVAKGPFPDMFVQRPQIDDQAVLARRRLGDHVDEGDNVWRVRDLLDGADGEELG